MSSRLLVVFLQEYLLRVRKRSFLLSTVLTPLLIASIFVLPTLFMTMNTERGSSLCVADESGVLIGPLRTALADTSKAPAADPPTGRSDDAPDRSQLSILDEPINSRSRDALLADLGRRVANEEIDAALYIPNDVLEGGECRYYARNVSDFRRNQRLERAIDRAVRDARIARSNLDAETVKRLLAAPGFSTFKVTPSGAASKDEGRTFIVAYILGYLFYMMLAIYSAQMLRVVLEEKTSRSAEVIISVVRPSELVGGKILASAAVALTQMIVWALVIWGITMQAGGGSGMSAVLSDGFSQSGLTAGTFAIFGAYFLLGFLFYATIFGAVGAMISSEEEAQQAQLPIMLPMIAATFLIILAIRDPNAPLVVICSFIPFFAPILMTVRLCVLPPPAWQIATTLALMAASAIGVTWIAGRIFRVGLLMYGKRPNLPELIKWIQQK